MDVKKLKLTPTDSTKEIEGQWTSYYNVDLLIARTSKPSYTNELMRVSKSIKNKLDRNAVNNDEMTEIMCRAISKHLLLGWKNFRIGEDDIEYSRENAYHLLKNDLDLRNFVLEYAEDASNYHREEIDEKVGESLTS